MNKTLKPFLLAASIAVTGAMFTGSAFAGAAEDAIADAKAAPDRTTPAWSHIRARSSASMSG